MKENTFPREQGVNPCVQMIRINILKKRPAPIGKKSKVYHHIIDAHCYHICIEIPNIIIIVRPSMKPPGNYSALKQA